MVIYLNEVSDAVEDHVTGRLRLRGAEAVERYREYISKLFENTWTTSLVHQILEYSRCAYIDFNDLLHRLVIAKKEQFDTRWPGRGRPAKCVRRIVNDELAQQLEELLKTRYKGKKTILAQDIRIDLKTFNKILAGGRVTDTTKQKIRDWTAAETE